ncbi:MAG: Chromosome segregation DNA-binding protein [Candidatus Uhrbacteria bacterium GW2011_GWD2_52_7]|uniref:Chromosome segregation DNA-binding protein n=1 Tax=Candidatus Uhrbacteria bacterium GW2011_GWD2_52_7 TaxID=1618989 RepID=A0A0G1ZRB9_9BACT|nr:MAG: Chromosome segregation DNA-binding protein [Candidatus Uhrbacteria bacterium GW2011_GWD2_52_7]
MQKPKGGLGRGLGSLLPQQPLPQQAPVLQQPIAAPDVVHDEGLRIHEISPSAIVENPHQPRTHFAEEELSDLKASIQEHGILQPLVVTDLGGGKYELIAGERRLRSARAVGLNKVPVIVREADEQQKLELALIENIQRADLNAVEEARAYKSLIENFGLTQEAVSGRVGKSRSQVANMMRLLELDDDILDALMMGRISKSHARTLLAEPDHHARRDLFTQMLEGGMTVRTAEAKAGSRSRKLRPDKDPNIAAIEAQLREKLGTKVAIDMQNGIGKVAIHFYSKDDLRSLIERLTS